jgi:hypothetical protein
MPAIELLYMKPTQTKKSTGYIFKVISDSAEVKNYDFNMPEDEKDGFEYRDIISAYLEHISESEYFNVKRDYVGSMSAEELMDKIDFAHKVLSQFQTRKDEIIEQLAIIKDKLTHIQQHTMLQQFPDILGRLTILQTNLSSAKPLYGYNLGEITIQLDGLLEFLRRVEHYSSKTKTVSIEGENWLLLDDTPLFYAGSEAEAVVVVDAKEQKDSECDTSLLGCLNQKLKQYNVSFTRSAARLLGFTGDIVGKTEHFVPMLLDLKDLFISQPDEAKLVYDKNQLMMCWLKGQLVKESASANHLVIHHSNKLIAYLKAVDQADISDKFEDIAADDLCYPGTAEPFNKLKQAIEDRIAEGVEPHELVLLNSLRQVSITYFTSIKQRSSNTSFESGLEGDVKAVGTACKRIISRAEKIGILCNADVENAVQDFTKFQSQESVPLDDSRAAGYGYSLGAALSALTSLWPYPSEQPTAAMPTPTPGTGGQ